MHGGTGRKKTPQSGKVDTVIEFNVFASVKRFIKQTNLLEYFPAIRDCNALGRHKSSLVRIDIGGRVMTKPRAAGRGDRLLYRRGSFDLKRLRAANTISATATKRVSEIGQVPLVINLAMSVDNEHDFPL